MEITKDPFVSWKAGSSYVGLVEESFNNAVAKGQMSNKEKDYWQEIQDVVDKLSNDPAVSEGIKREEIENEARERFR